MCEVDRAKHEAEDLAGKAKEKVGDVTDNHSLQAEGVADQVKANVGKAGDDLRDAVRGRNEDDDEQQQK